MRKIIICVAATLLTSSLSAAVVDSMNAGPRHIRLRPTVAADGSVIYEEVWVDDELDPLTQMPAVVNGKVAGPRKIILRPTAQADGSVIYEEVWVEDDFDPLVQMPAAINAKVAGAEARIGARPRVTTTANGRLVPNLNTPRSKKR